MCIHLHCIVLVCVVLCVVCDVCICMCVGIVCECTVHKSFIILSWIEAWKSFRGLNFANASIHSFK